MPKIDKRGEPAPAPTYERQPGMPVEIPLKLKYRAPKPSKRNKSDYSGRANKKHNKRPLTKEEIARHAAQPDVVVRLVNGKLRKEITPK